MINVCHFKVKTNNLGQIQDIMKILVECKLHSVETISKKGM